MGNGMIVKNAWSREPLVTPAAHQFKPGRLTMCPCAKATFDQKTN
ncbi:hypothetical protein COLO4_35666 [Corchorus olitorius]|uniref:Uncharacterized protein n=1 Tax=Corchorus olitorius TaxID=93759 RepID=A0A1R3GE49_9ROSI|nr:hypothetical protein COLO4_35666 [Corchorus olitorius]